MSTDGSEICEDKYIEHEFDNKRKCKHCDKTFWMILLGPEDEKCLKLNDSIIKGIIE